VEDPVGRSWKSIRHAGMALVALSLITSLGCTRESGKTERVKFAIPSEFKVKRSKLGTYATLIPAHIVVNVHASETGGGLLAAPPAWDACHDDCDPATMPAPPVFEVNVPSGNGRLVQVLIAAIDSTDSESGYYWLYDDELVNLTAGVTTEVALSPQQLGGATPVEGQLTGRYLTGPDSGPTGTMAIMVSPVANRPKMLLEKNYMFNGYFSTFAIEGAGFHFVLPATGQQLFGGGEFSFSNLSFGTHLAKVQVPDHYRSWDGGATRQFEKGKTIAFGYFGDPAYTAGKKACLPTASQAIAGAYAGSTGSTLVNWAISAPSPSQFGPLAGGHNSTCTGTEFQDVFSLDLSLIGSQGMHSALKSRSAFKIFSNGSHFDAVHYTYSGTTLTLDWEFLPGVTSGARPVSGVAVFYKANGEPEIKHSGDGIDCDRLAGSGFNRIDVPNSSSSYAITGVASLSGYGAVVCPIVDGKVVNGGVQAHINGGGPMGGGKQIKIVGPRTPTQGVCTAYSVEIRDSSGNLTTPDNGGATFTLAASTGSLFTDNGCGTPLSALSFAAADTSRTFYFMDSGVGYRSIQLSPPPNDYQYFNGLDIGVISGSYGPIDHLQVSVPYAMATDRCYYVQVRLEDSSYNPTVSAGAVNVSLTLDDGSTPTPSHGSFHLSNNCSDAAVTNISVPGGSHVGDFYFKPSYPVSGSAVSRRIMADISSPVVATTSSPSSFQVGPAVVDHYKLFDDSGMLSSLNSTCKRVFLEPMNVAGAYLSVAAAVSVNVHFTGSATVTFHGNDNTCGGAGTSTAAFNIMANSTSSQPVYVKVSSGSGSVTQNFDDGTISGPVSPSISAGI
jgi:hypothetical protein